MCSSYLNLLLPGNFPGLLKSNFHLLYQGLAAIRRIYSISIDYVIDRMRYCTSGPAKSFPSKFLWNLNTPCHIDISSYHSRASTRLGYRLIPSRISVCCSSTISYLGRILVGREQVMRRLHSNFQNWNILSQVHRSFAYKVRTWVVFTMYINSFHFILMPTKM